MRPDREPSRRLGRPSSMRRLGTAVVLPVLLAAAACGQESGAGSAGDAADPSGVPTAGATSWGECTADDLASATGRTGSLDTSQGRVRLTLVTGDGPCAGGLVAQVDDGVVSGVDVSGLDLDPATASIVEPTGAATPGQLLRVDSVAHPRGGFQPHLFVHTPEGLEEVLLDGRPLLPFVATDGGALPMTAVCTGAGGVGVLTATTSKPPGVVLAWDVRLTTYDVSAGDAVQTSDQQVEDHAADPALRKERPELFDTGVLFPGCSRPWRS